MRRLSIYRQYTISNKPGCEVDHKPISGLSPLVHRDECYVDAVRSGRPNSRSDKECSKVSQEWARYVSENKSTMNHSGGSRAVCPVQQTPCMRLELCDLLMSTPRLAVTTYLICEGGGGIEEEICARSGTHLFECVEGVSARDIGWEILE